jgi:hypothetical protein
MRKHTFIFLAVKGVSVFVSSMLLNLALVSPAEADPAWKSREKITIMVTNFYSEYIAKAKRPRDQQSILQANLTPDFFNDFKDLVEGMDPDPIVRSEHWGADYRYKIRVYNVSLVGEDSARADVRLGEIPQGVKSPSGPVTLRLNLKKSENRWRIASVERGFDNP